MFIVKGVSLFIEAVILVAIAVVFSTLVGGWLSSMSGTQSDKIQNSTTTQLQCEFGRIFIKSAAYNCSNKCDTGTIHNLTLNVANSGKIRVSMDRIFIINTTGTTFSLNLNETVFIDPGATKALTNISTDTCNGINRTIDEIVVSSQNCPSTAYSSISGSDVTFTNC